MIDGKMFIICPVGNGRKKNSLVEEYLVRKIKGLIHRGNRKQKELRTERKPSISLYFDFVMWKYLDLR